MNSFITGENIKDYFKYSYELTKDDNFRYGYENYISYRITGDKVIVLTENNVKFIVYPRFLKWYLRNKKLKVILNE